MIGEKLEKPEEPEVKVFPDRTNERSKNTIASMTGVRCKFVPAFMLAVYKAASKELLSVRDPGKSRPRQRTLEELTVHLTEMGLLPAGMRKYPLIQGVNPNRSKDEDRLEEIRSNARERALRNVEEQFEKLRRQSAPHRDKAKKKVPSSKKGLSSKKDKKSKKVA